MSESYESWLHRNGRVHSSHAEALYKAFIGFKDVFDTYLPLLRIIPRSVFIGHLIAELRKFDKQPQESSRTLEEWMELFITWREK